MAIPNNCPQTIGFSRKSQKILKIYSRSQLINSFVTIDCNDNIAGFTLNFEYRPNIVDIDIIIFSRTPDWLLQTKRVCKIALFWSLKYKTLRPQRCSRRKGWVGQIGINILLLMGLFGGFSVLEGLSTVVSYGPSFSMYRIAILFPLRAGERNRNRQSIPLPLFFSHLYYGGRNYLVRGLGSIFARFIVSFMAVTCVRSGKVDNFSGTLYVNGYGINNSRLVMSAIGDLKHYRP